MSKVAWSTSHRDHHLLVNITFDSSLLVRILIENNIFELKFGRGVNSIEFVDFFIYEISKIVAESPLKKY